MTRVTVELPEGVEKKVIEEALQYEAKKRALLNFLDEMMKGARQLPEKELVRLGRQIKKGRYEELRNKGLI